MEQTRENDRDWLDGIDVAAPCPASWDAMKGDDRCRLCSQCSLHVFDLSAMTRTEAEELVASRTGQRLCVRFTRRADGTVLTADCPVGLRQRLRRTASKLVAMCAALLPFLGCRAESQPPTGGGDGPPDVEIEPLQGEVVITGVAAPPEHVMGRIRAEPPPPKDR